VADWLTLFRGILAVLLVIAGIASLESLFRIATLLILLGWTTDVIDGPIARYAKQQPSTIGEKEIVFDFMLFIGGYLYYVFAGYISIKTGLLYVLIVFVVIVIFRSQSLTQLVSIPMMAAPIYLSYTYDYSLFLLFIAWIIICVIADWSRFSEVVQIFFSGMEELFTRKFRNS
jgi:phosphatidylglycerophosphate synthase